jgi:hypothetical protein
MARVQLWLFRISMNILSRFFHHFLLLHPNVRLDQSLKLPEGKSPSILHATDPSLSPP